MSSEESYINERLDHLGIVAGVCQEMGLAAWLDAQDPTHRQQVSVGTATVAMILNGLGWSLRQLYLVPQYFANKPVEQRHGCGDQGRDARVSTAWGARSIGCTRMIPPSCLLALLDKHARSLA
jgi:DNA-binding transcriptional LysR family regulator